MAIQVAEILHILKPKTTLIVRHTGAALDQHLNEQTQQTAILIYILQEMNLVHLQR